MYFYFSQLRWLILQKCCDLGAQLSAMNKQQISLNLDLELAKKNLKTARDEVAAMGGTKRQLSISLLALFLSIF